MGAKPQHDPAYRRLCAEMRAWREGAGLTQRALAERLKRPHSFVYKIESGNRRIDPIEMAHWVNACGVAAAAVIKAMGVKGRAR